MVGEYNLLTLFPFLSLSFVLARCTPSNLSPPVATMYPPLTVPLLGKDFGPGGTVRGGSKNPMYFIREKISAPSGPARGHSKGGGYSKGGVHGSYRGINFDKDYT